jgi:predicted nucleotidyltransferase
VSHRQVVDAHRKDIVAIAARYGASNVRIFGSVVRGDATPDSDVDLLVDIPEHTRPGSVLLVVAGLAEELSELLGFRVDVATVGILRPEVAVSALEQAVPLEE